MRPSPALVAVPARGRVRHPADRPLASRAARPGSYGSPPARDGLHHTALALDCNHVYVIVTRAARRIKVAERALGWTVRDGRHAEPGSRSLASSTHPAAGPPRRPPQPQPRLVGPLGRSPVHSAPQPQPYLVGPLGRSPTYSTPSTAAPPHRTRTKPSFRCRNSHIFSVIRTFAWRGPTFGLIGAESSHRATLLPRRSFPRRPLFPEPARHQAFPAPRPGTIGVTW